jgi:hypothetical protein
MVSTIRATSILAALILGAAASGQAQTHRNHLGPRVSYDFDADAPGLGMQLGVPVARHLEFYPSVDFFFPDVGSLVAVNADVKYRAGRAESSWLYVGTGLNIASRKVHDVSHTNSGLNLFMGIESLRGRVHPFGEIRLTVGDGSKGQLAGGLNFTL